MRLRLHLVSRPTLAHCVRIQRVKANIKLTNASTAPKAKKRKTEPVPEEVDDEEEVEGEADDDVDGKDLEDDEENAGEEDADEDVSCRTYSRLVS
jgi:hypothetical protein